MKQAIVRSHPRLRGNCLDRKRRGTRPMKCGLTLLIASAALLSGTAHAQSTGETPTPLGYVEAQSDANFTLDARFKKKFDTAPLIKIRCKKSFGQFKRGCTFLFITTGRHDAFLGKLTIRADQPVLPPEGRGFFYKGSATRFDGPCLVHTRQRAGCAKSKYPIP
jgi:hypothetical protein